MREELGSITIRIEAWDRELHAIEQQHQHHWALESMTREDAQDAIEATWAIANELHTIAERIGHQAERAAEWLDE
jgi:hypothetical protein